MRRGVLSGCFAVAAVLVVVACALAAPASGSEWAYDIDVQADGRILALGESDEEFALVRYEADGAIDNAFGTGGMVTTDFGAQFGAEARASAIQADGKVVAFGYAYDFDLDRQNFALVRYNADGTLDSTFGTGGKVTTDFGGLPCGAEGGAIQSDGKIIAVGVVDDDFALVRYNADGTLDNTFGVGGKVRTDFGGGTDWAYDLLVQADGKAVAVGWGSGGFALARYNTDGTLDLSFGTSGLATTGFGDPGARAFGAALQGDGKILAAGSANDGFALARYNPDGTLDGSFGTGGVVTTAFGEPGSAFDVALQGDGKIVATGTVEERVGFALARYNADGSLDSSFGTGGRVTTSFGDVEAAAYGVAIQPDGKIVAGGSAYDAALDANVALARYNADGSLDSSFGIDGMIGRSPQSPGDDDPGEPSNPGGGGGAGPPATAQPPAPQPTEAAKPKTTTACKRARSTQGKARHQVKSSQSKLRAAKQPAAKRRLRRTIKRQRASLRSAARQVERTCS